MPSEVHLSAVMHLIHAPVHHVQLSFSPTGSTNLLRRFVACAADQPTAAAAASCCRWNNTSAGQRTDAMPRLQRFALLLLGRFQMQNMDPWTWAMRSWIHGPGSGGVPCWASCSLRGQTAAAASTTGWRTGQAACCSNVITPVPVIGTVHRLCQIMGRVRLAT
jgi:hypothetical protein